MGRRWVCRVLSEQANTHERDRLNGQTRGYRGLIGQADDVAGPGVFDQIRNGGNKTGCLNRSPGEPSLAGTRFGLRRTALPACDRKSGQFMCYETGQVY